MTRTQLPMSRRFRVGCRVTEVLILVAAGAVRFYAAQDDFWLDEIWSLWFAGSARSIWDIFAKIHHDNNHHLVTLWMYTWGAQENWFLYRLPSVIAGVGTVALAARAARQWGEIQALAATVLTASSYLLIVYASEARGYALAGFFALAGFLSLQRFFTTRSWRANLLFCMTVVAGFLSHLTFLHFYTAAVAWSLWEFRIDLQKMDSRRAIQDQLRLHCLPCCFIAALYLVDVRHLMVGGGNPSVMQVVIAEALAYAIGGPTTAPDLAWAAALSAGAGIAALICLWRETPALGIFFTTVVLVSPASLLLLHHPEAMYVRYFYINLLFLLLLLSFLLGRLYELGSFGKFVYCALLGLLVFGNLLHTVPFLNLGRGHYLEAVRYMAQKSAGPEFEVASDHDFRNRLVLEFYAKKLPKTQSFVYRPHAPPAEWIVFHNQSQQWQPPRSFVHPLGTRYRLGRVFPYAGLSGWHWAVYHQVTEP